jgi:uncharacterized protein (TIGR03083 family)
MQPAGIHLDAAVHIPVLEPLRRVNAALLELLRGFTAEDWRRPTVHPDRDVKDLTAHLLQGSLGRVSAIRDGYRPRPTRAIAGITDLIAAIQADNRAFMRAMRGVSPRILIDLLAVYDREMVAAFEALDPEAAGLAVAWAGEEISCNWFDVAREYTEKWHHQQQLRDATGRPALYERGLLTPVLETFARGLPFAFRSREATEGTRVSLTVTGPVTLCWTLRQSGGAWSLWSGADPAAQASISMPADVAWRVWTKGIGPDEARVRMEVSGDGTLAGPVTTFVAVMA